MQVIADWSFNMKKRKDLDNLTCPITFALDIFGDRWSLLIIRDLLFKKKKYYSDFLSSAEKISTNILADRLVKLESEGIISKISDPKNSSKHTYRLSPKGMDLIPLIIEIVIWSSIHDSQPESPSSIIAGAPKNFLKRARADRDGLIAEIIANIEN